MNGVMPLRAVYLFGSHARGDARPDSDVDLCLVAEGATRQLEAVRGFARAIRPVRPKPSFTLVPITPERLAEKRDMQDYFHSHPIDRQNRGVPCEFLRKRRGFVAPF